DEAAAGREMAIVNQRFAAMFFPGENPLGRRIQLEPPNPAGTGARGPWFTIVGVVQTLPQLLLVGLAPEPAVLAPFFAEPGPIRFVSVIVRARSGPAEAVALVREDVRHMDPDLPLFAVQTLDDMAARTRYPTRLMGSLFGLFALIALVVASVGLFAL